MTQMERMEKENKILKLQKQWNYFADMAYYFETNQMWGDYGGAIQDGNNCKEEIEKLRKELEEDDING